MSHSLRGNASPPVADLYGQMIAIPFYSNGDRISVLERTKEIGNLQAVGPSKRNISQVFNAEIFIIGLLSGWIGVDVTLLFLISGNAIIHAVTGSKSANAALPLTSAVLLIVLSVILTLIGGLILSRTINRMPLLDSHPYGDVLSRVANDVDRTRHRQRRKVKYCINWIKITKLMFRLKIDSL